jgi:glycerol-3-phosphate dehydrogenase (NAD(P)+)
MKKTNIAILGDGGWGTTLAIVLSQNGHKVSLWGAFPEYVAYLNKKRINTRFLPGIKIPGAIHITDDLASVIRDKQVIVIAVPSQYIRGVLKKVKQLEYPREAAYVSVTKGIEIKSFKRMSEVIQEELQDIKVAVVSGPTIAHEVAKGIPTTAVIASADPSVRRHLQNIFMNNRFRIYTNSDIIGVELGGSLKNVIAIACGISDGLGFGANTKAAILARGLAEMSRLGVAMGAKAGTFSGISGLGDLVTTCISEYSRNRSVGEQIGKGKSITQIRRTMQMVAEGVPTAKSAYELSLKYKVDMPITKEVYTVLYRKKSPQKAVKNLMMREKKEE